MSHFPRSIDVNSNLDALHALNEAHAVELSSLTIAKLRTMIAMAFYARQIEPDKAMLIAFDQDGNYDSVNFIWFRDRYQRFVYVDRIVVADDARGQGIARCLYEDLFACARAGGHERIVCEVNAHPPNPASDQFHAAMGFVEVGMAELPASGLQTGKAKDTAKGKIVRYFEKSLTGLI